MFYTIYDAIVFKADKDGIKEDEVKKRLRKRGLTSEQLGLLKNNCTTLLTEDILDIIFDEFELKRLEIDLMLGSIPKEYEKSYLNHISAIADLLKEEETQKRKGRKKGKIEFKTNRGKLYHADCLEILPQIQDNTIDLIFADPPFNLKKEYANGRSDDLTISKIVVTTNFDKLYEGLCHEPEYITFDYTNTRSIIGSIKAPENIIIKAHGSIDDTEKLIFTAKQYYQAQEKYPEFYHLMTALFLTHTVVFLGYSLNDPDINLLLQFLHNTANSSCPHYMIDKKGNKPQLIKHWKDTYNVSLLEYGDDYSCLESSLEELRDLVVDLREERRMP